MNSLKHTYFKRQCGVSIPVFFLLSVFFMGLQHSGESVRLQGPDLTVQHDVNNYIHIHLDVEKSTDTYLVSSGYPHHWEQDLQLFNYDQKFSPGAQKSIPPVDLRSDNEPAGEDERRLLPDLNAPFTDIHSWFRHPKYEALNLSISSPALGLALRHLSTVVLLH